MVVAYELMVKQFNDHEIEGTNQARKTGIKNCCGWLSQDIFCTT